MTEMTEAEATTLKQNKQATKELLLRMNSAITPRQWQKVRTTLGMSKAEIMEDETYLFMVGAWHKEGGELFRFEEYMDKTEGELQEALGFDTATAESIIVKTLDDA